MFPVPELFAGTGYAVTDQFRYKVYRVCDHAIDPANHFFLTFGPIRKGVVAIREIVDPDCDKNGTVTMSELSNTGYQLHRQVKHAGGGWIDDDFPMGSGGVGSVFLSFVIGCPTGGGGGIF